MIIAPERSVNLRGKLSGQHDKGIASVCKLEGQSSQTQMKGLQRNQHCS